MKYLLSLILSYFLYLNCNAQAPAYDWQLYNTGFNVQIIKLTFTDSLHGWGLGLHSIIHTDDGGETWQQQQLPVDSVDFRKFCFVDSMTGYIVGGSGLILATKDGGKNWLRQESGDSEHLLRGISFINRDTGWVTGEMDNGIKRGGILLYTNNGGITWDTLGDRSDNILYYDVKFYDASHGMVIGSYGFDNFTPIKVFKTTDSGVSLPEVTEFTGADIFDLYFSQPDTMYGGGFGIAKSFDGGFTWNSNIQLQIKDSTLYGFPIIDDILLINGKTGWATIYFLNKRSVLYYTNDYGDHWYIVATPEGFSPYCLAYSGKYFFVGGKNGLIITNKPKPADVFTEKHERYSFKLNQNYPNPFNPTTIIEYQLPQNAFVSLKVYDILGRVVRTLVNENKTVGKYSISFDASKLASGIYIYQLKVNAGGTNNFVSTKKMQLLK